MFKFNNPINLINNIRETRKIMEIATPPLGLVINWNNQVVGYDKTKKDYECEIIINGHLSWQIEASDLHLKYENGLYSIMQNNDNDDANKYNAINKLNITSSSLKKIKEIKSRFANST